jgi:PAS domain S-box-containing protein
MLLVDDEGRVVWMSDGLASMCGDPERCRGRPWVETLVGQSEGERLATTLSRVGHLANESVSLRVANGESIPVKLSAARLGDAEASWATITIARPETRPQITDRRFPYSPDCLRAILDTSPDGVVVVGRDRRIAYVNPAAEQMLDHPKEEIVGQPVDLYVHRCECLDQIADALRPNRPVLGQDLQLRRRDGTVICVSVSASLLRLRDGTDMGAVAYLRDVTERRRTEEGLARSNAQLEHYVDAVSHDLRSPLVSLLGFSRLLREDYGARLEEKGRHFLDRIEQAGRTMESLIHDLLELSRIGRTDASRSLIDPRTVLSHLYAEFKPRLDQEGASLELPEDLPLLMCNRTRLYQLFSNLVGNALERRPPDHRERQRQGNRSRPSRPHLRDLPEPRSLQGRPTGHGNRPCDREKDRRDTRRARLGR